MTLTFSILLLQTVLTVILGAGVLLGIHALVSWKALRWTIKPRKLSTILRIAQEYYTPVLGENIGKSSQFFCVAATLAWTHSKITKKERARVQEYARELIADFEYGGNVLASAVECKVEGNKWQFCDQIWDAVIDKLEADGK